MSLFPYVFNRLNTWDPFNFPSSSWSLLNWPERIFNQNFGLDMDEWKDFFGSSMPFDWTGRNPAEIAKRSGISRIKNDPNMFSIKLDVSQFAPNEITVKTVDNNVIITGNHEERRDDHGWISRQFTRRYALPEGCKEEDVISSLTPNGVLLIEAPKKCIEMPATNERIIPITMKEAKESIKAPEEEEKKAVKE